MDSVLDLFGTISLDTAGYEKGVKAAEKQANELAKKLDSAGKSSDDAGHRIENVGNSATNAGNAMRTGGESSADMAERLDTAGQAADGLWNDLSQVSDAAADLDRDMTEGGAAAREIADGLDDAADSATGFEDDITGAGDSLGGLGEQADDTEESLNGLGDFFKAGVLLQAAEQLSKLSDKLQELGSAALESYQDMDEATRKVTGYFAETGDQAELTSARVKSIFEAGFGDSVDSVADALIVVKQNLGEIDSFSLNTITTAAIQMDEIFGIDISESIRGVKSLMTQFGMSATDAMDLLVAGTQNGLDKTDELGDNVSEYAGKFAQAGYSASEYFQLLNNGLDNGAYNLDKVNDAINEVTNRLADGTIGDALESYSGKTQELFAAWQNGEASQKDVVDSIVSDIASCENQQEALNLATTAFGTLAEDGSLKFITALSSVGDTYNDVQDAASNMLDSTMSQQQQLEANTRKLKDAFIPLGEKLAEIANTILPPLVLIVSKIGDLFNDLPEPVQNFVVILGILTTAFAAIAPVVAALAISFGALDVSLLPVIAVIAAVAAAIAGIIAIVKNWGTITEWLSNKWNSFTEFFGGIWDGIKQKVSDAVEHIKETFGNIVDSIKDTFNSVVDTVSGVFDTIGNAVQVGFMLIQEIINAAAQILLLPFNFIWENFGEQITNFFTGIAEKVSGFFSALRDKFSAGWEAITSVTGTVWDAVSGKITSAWATITGIVSGAANAVGNVVSGVFSSIANTVSSVMATVSNVVSTVWNAIKNAVSNAVNTVKTTVSSVFNALVNIVSGPVNAAKTAVENAFNGIKNTISNVINNAKNVVSNGLNAIKRFFNNLRLKFPNIKLPHFSISGGFSLNPPSVPHFSVQWYKRAMQGAYLLDSPTLFGTGNGIAGGGEAGNEYIVGQRSLEQTIRNQINEALSAYANADTNAMLTLLAQYLPEIARGMQIDGKKLAKNAAGYFDDELGRRAAQAQRGLG